MSDAVFPSELPGLEPSATVSPRFSTKIQSSVSLRETRAAFSAYPIWDITLAFEFLRANAVNQELDKLVGFFLQMRGSHDSFLLTVPNDNAVSDMQFGIGDGSTSQFQLTRFRGADGFGFVEPVQNINQISGIWLLDDFGRHYLHPSRANLLTYSEQLDASPWITYYLHGFGGGSIANAIQAPDGTTTAEKLVEDSTANVIRSVRRFFEVEANVTYTFSIFVKSAERHKLALYVPSKYSDGSSFYGAQVKFDLTTESVTDVAGSTMGNGIIPSGNGWYRIWLAVLATETAIDHIQLQPLDENGSSTYDGDGISGFYAWGAQLEPGDSPGSYLPTSGNITYTSDYSIDPTGLVQLATPPALGSSLIWTGTYYYRCRFKDDTADFEKFMYDLWKLKKIEMVGAPGNKIL